MAQTRRDEPYSRLNVCGAPRFSPYRIADRGRPVIVRRAREYLEAHSDRNVFLTELAEVVGRDLF
jgi:hypothetical protein